jgi:hypothetical protein
MPLARKQTIPTERPLPVGEVSANFCGEIMSRGQRNGSPRPLISGFYTRSRYFSIQVPPTYSCITMLLYCFILWRTHYFNSDYVYVKSAWFHTKILRHLQFCNF